MFYFIAGSILGALISYLISPSSLTLGFFNFVLQADMMLWLAKQTAFLVSRRL